VALLVQSIVAVLLLLPLSLPDRTVESLLATLLRLFLVEGANSQLGPSMGSESIICSRKDSLGFSGKSENTGADVLFIAGEGVGRNGVEEGWL